MIYEDKWQGTLPSFSFQFEERTVKSGAPPRSYRRVSVMFAPQHERPPPMVPRQASSQDTYCNDDAG